MVARCSARWDDAAGVARRHSRSASAPRARAHRRPRLGGRPRPRFAMPRLGRRLIGKQRTSRSNASSSRCRGRRSRSLAWRRRCRTRRSSPPSTATATYRADAAAAAALAAGGASRRHISSGQPRRPRGRSPAAPRPSERASGAGRRCALLESRSAVSDHSSLTDAELVARCRAGDADAWNELVERFSRYVYAIAVEGFRLSEEDAEDVFQDVFTRVYTRLDTLRDDAALRPWIAQLTRRLLPRRDRGKRDGRRGRDRGRSERPERRRGGVRRTRGDVRASRTPARNPRPLLRARPELQHDRRRARHPVRNHREPHRTLPRQLRERARGKKRAFRVV